MRAREEEREKERERTHLSPAYRTATHAAAGYLVRSSRRNKRRGEEKDKMNSARPIARARRSSRAKQMAPEAAHVPLGVQRIIRRLFPFYATARANDILRPARALVTVSIIPGTHMTYTRARAPPRKSPCARTRTSAGDIRNILCIYRRS